MDLILKLSIDGSMLEPVLITQYSNCLCTYYLSCISLKMFESLCIYCGLKVLIKFAKMSLNANGPNALHVKACDMLFVMVWLRGQFTQICTYSTVILNLWYIYVCIELFVFRGGKWWILFLYVLKWFVDGRIVKRWFITKWSLVDTQ